MTYKLKLLDWGLQMYTTAFEEEGIDDNSFLLIDDETIRKIFTKSGPRLIFKKKFIEFRKLKDTDSLDSINFVAETDSTVSTDTLVSFDNSDIIFELFDGTESNEQNTAEINKTPISNNPQSSPFNITLDTRTLENSQETPLSKKRKITSVFPQGLEIVLKKYTEGQIVLNHKDRLNNDLRQKLCKVIINELIAIYGSELKAALLIKVAEEVTVLFEKEQTETYFIPYGRDLINRPSEEKDNTGKSKCHNARGKLWSRYVYVRSALRVSNAQKKNIDEPDQAEVSEACNTSLESSYLDFLKVGIEPFTKVLEAWEETFKIRRKLYINTDLTTILNDFPCLKLNNGIELIETDFNRKFTDKTDTIYNTWPHIANAVLAEAKDRKISIPTVINCHDNLLHAVLILPYLFTPVTLKKSRKGGLWRPTRSEIAESFFLHLMTYDELEEKIISRQRKLQEYGLTLQPFGVIIGPANNPEAFYIVADEVKYKIDTVLRTFELLYKFFHALDVEYPLECEHIWLFVAEVIYKTKPTKQSPAATALITDIKHHIDI